MSAFTTSFTGVRVVSKTTVAKKTVQTKAVASFDNVKKVRDDDDDSRVSKMERSIDRTSARDVDSDRSRDIAGYH